jgi:hypothetical protein
MIYRILAIILVVSLLSVFLGKWVFLVLLILILIVIIRFFADLFWLGKDKEWW